MQIFPIYLLDEVAGMEISIRAHYVLFNGIIPAMTKLLIDFEIISTLCLPNTVQLSTPFLVQERCPTKSSGTSQVAQLQ